MLRGLLLMVSLSPNNPLKLNGVLTENEQTSRMQDK